jgi:hypothetical protein
MIRSCNFCFICIFVILFLKLCSVFDSPTCDAELSCVCHKAYALCTISVNYFCRVIQMSNVIRKGVVKILNILAD